MRSKIQVQKMFEALKQQRDGCDDNDARTVSNLYARALAWVLEDSQVKGLLLSEESIYLYNCVN